MNPQLFADIRAVCSEYMHNNPRADAFVEVLSTLCALMRETIMIAADIMATDKTDGAKMVDDAIDALSKDLRASWDRRHK